MYHVRTQHEDQELWARYDKVAMLHTWSKKADIAHQKDIHLKQLKKTGGRGQGSIKPVNITTRLKRI